MVENKSSLFGIIAIIIGASGLGLGVFSVVNFQTVEGIPGDDGQDGIEGDDGQDGIDGDDAPGGIIVGILDPDEGETISGNVTIRAMIAGSEAYTVSILRNGTEIGTTLPMKWNTILVPDGWWNITVIVMDVLTQDQSSDHVLVYVDNNPTMTRVYLQGNMLDLSDGYYFLEFDATSYDPEISSWFWSILTDLSLSFVLWLRSLGERISFPFLPRWTSSPPLFPAFE